VQAVEHLRVAHDPLEGPGQRGRGGLVPGDEQGDQLVAQLLVGHPPAVLVAGLHEERQDVRSALEVLLAPAPPDLLEEQVVDRRQVLVEAGPGSLQPDREPEREDDEDHERALGRIEHALESVPQAVEALALLEAEDGPNDHVEGYGLHAGPDREGLPSRPALELPLGGLDDQLAVGLHPLAVEGGEHQLAMAHVRMLVEQKHGVRAHQRLEQHPPLAGVHQLGARLVDLLDQLGVGDEDHRPVDAEADREDVAVALPALAHERRGPERPAQGL
jgi:hypothetical protein